MRNDMYKVIVERPRWGNRMRTREGRLHRASEDVASKIGIKQGYVSRKSLNENLSPLKRWLESQANRPWDKVYAELCANIDRRNTVQEHIFAHIDQFVETQTRLFGGKVHVMRGWGAKWEPVEESSARLYVHPVTLRWRRWISRICYPGKAARRPIGSTRHTGMSYASAAFLSIARRGAPARIPTSYLETPRSMPGPNGNSPPRSSNNMGLETTTPGIPGVVVCGRAVCGLAASP
ncbi:MAG: hypothetical protein ACKVQA_03525 [Burkholderiales bacterium]